MRIAETASHCPFHHHELSISRHVPEKEYSIKENKYLQKVREQNQDGKGGER